LLLAKLNDGDTGAAAELLPLVYERLRAIANQHFEDQRSNHTLQPTALVHEAYMKLLGTDAIWRDRGHFCAVAATAMRQILVDHARRKRASKRDVRHVDLTVDNLQTPAGTNVIDIVALDDALAKLSDLNGRYSRLVELRIFGGMTLDEIAKLEGVSDRTLRKDWRNIRAWMNRELAVAS